MFEKQSMINRLSNPINSNRSAAKISKVMSSNVEAHIMLTAPRTSAVDNARGNDNYNDNDHGNDDETKNKS